VLVEFIVESDKTHKGKQMFAQFNSGFIVSLLVVSLFGCGTKLTNLNDELAEGDAETQALYAGGTSFSENACKSAPSARGRAFCNYMLSEKLVALAKQVKDRVAELRSNGVTDITGSCTVTQALGLSLSGAMPNYELRSFPKFTRADGSRFGVVPESTFKLRAAFTWEKINSDFDFSLKGRLKGYPRTFRSRANWLKITSMNDLLPGDLVMSKNLEHSYMFLDWKPCSLINFLDCGVPRARVIDNSAAADKWGESALVEKNITQSYYTFQEAWRAPN
jgi:hypothetical protein